MESCRSASQRIRVRYGHIARQVMTEIGEETQN